MQSTTKAVRQLSFIRCVAGFAAAACLLFAPAVASAQTNTAGILPPHNPASDCDHASFAGGSWGLTNIDSCRALEGVGALTLPSNWNTLTPVQQGFVLIDLERVNRGLAPIVGLSRTLNQLASSGASNGTDPSFPASGFMSGGAIWAGANSVFAADSMWMYDDGPNGLDSNSDCPSAGGPGCWGHRDVILWDKTPITPLVAGGGHTGTGQTSSYAYLVLAGYSASDLTFTWASELRYFTFKPTVEHTGELAMASPHKRKATKPKHHKHKHKH